MRPYHIRVKEYKKARERIFSIPKRKLRSIKRIREYYIKRKLYKSCVISPIISRELDSRPFVNLKIQDSFYLALLDSGANRSIIGGQLAARIQSNKEFRKCE